MKTLYTESSFTMIVLLNEMGLIDVVRAGRGEGRETDENTTKPDGKNCTLKGYIGNV